MTAPQSVRLAYVVRSGRIESEHFGQAVVCDASGRIVKAFGDTQVATYLRSAAKPFQATTCVRLGAAERFGWTDEDLAVVCASHSAEKEHLDRVRSILARAGLSEEDLGCGPHPPISVVERDRLIRSGVSPRRIHNNCSGKHAGMLAACRAKSWPIEGYLNREHPLQQQNLATMEAFARIPADSIPTGVDGCGVPTFYLPLNALATAYARLADSKLPPADFVSSVTRVAGAMREHPWLVAGRGRFTVELSERAAGRLLLKTGAEGLIAAAIPELGLGLAVKISDGSSRAHPVVVCRILAELVPDLDWSHILKSVNPPMENTRGEAVGEIVAAF